MNFVGSIVLAEYELSAEAIEWVRDNTSALNEDETSDTVFSFSRINLMEDLEPDSPEDEAILEESKDAYEDPMPAEVEEFLEDVRGLPEIIYELRIRVG